MVLKNQYISSFWYLVKAKILNLSGASTISGLSAAEPLQRNLDAGSQQGDRDHVEPNREGAPGQDAGAQAARQGGRSPQERQLHGHLGHGQVRQDMGPSGLQVPTHLSGRFGIYTYFILPLFF